MTTIKLGQSWFPGTATEMAFRNGRWGLRFNSLNPSPTSKQPIQITVSALDLIGAHDPLTRVLSLLLKALIPPPQHSKQTAGAPTDLDGNHYVTV